MKTRDWDGPPVGDIGSSPRRTLIKHEVAGPSTASPALKVTITHCLPVEGPPTTVAFIVANGIGTKLVDVVEKRFS
jgi:hypothetical protein